MTDTTTQPPPAPSGPSMPPTIDVRVLAHGFTRADVENALDKATRGPAREHWRPAVVERFEQPACPFDLEDPKALAADAGYHWSYAVYRAAGNE
jgi:hypothetical protein